MIYKKRFNKTSFVSVLFLVLGSSLLTSSVVASVHPESCCTSVIEGVSEESNMNSLDEEMSSDEPNESDKVAEFPGGLQGLMNFLSQNIKYPKSAVKNNIQGKVIVKFKVTKEGYVDSVKVVKGVDPVLDAEAVRVIKKMPRWTPGFHNGKVVNTYLNLPVTFRL